MKWAFFISLPLLSTFKVITQGFFSRGKIKTLADSIKFNGLMFLFAAVSLIIFNVRQLPSVETILYALALALLSLGFQTFYVLSFKTGAVSLSSTISAFSAVIPIIFSIIVYQETIGLFKYLGFALMAVAIVLMPSSKKDGDPKKGIKTSKKWFLFITITAICSGVATIVQQVFSKSAVANEKDLFTAITFIFAFIFSLILLPIIKGKQPLFKIDKKVGIGVIFCGLALGFYNLLVVIALSLIPASEFLPTNTGLIILTTVSLSSLVFKEVPSIKQILGIILAIVAVVFINL